MFNLGGESVSAILLKKYHTKKEVIPKTKNRFWYIILFLYAFNFFGIGELFPLLAIPYVIRILARTKFNRGFLCSLLILGFFSVFYGLLSFYYGYYSAVGLIGRVVYPIIFMVLGYDLIGESIDYRRAERLLFSFIIGLTLYAVFSFAKSIYLYGSVDNMRYALGGRNVLNLWSEGLISATALTAYLSFSLSSVSLLFIKETPKNKRMILLILFAASVYTIFQTSSRTGIMIVAVSSLTTTLFSEKISKSKIRRVALYLVSLISLSFLYNLNFLDIKNSVQNTYLYRRMELSSLETSRSDAWKTVWSNMMKYPLGGKGSHLEAGFAHNLWLDVAHEGGIYPFLLLVSFTLIAGMAIVKFLRNNHPFNFKAIVVSMLTAFGIIFMLEPVLQGLTLYFMFFCFFVGMVFKLNYLEMHLHGVNSKR